MLIPVVLSGGSGTRLWPVSRETCPKPFIRVGNGPSLLQRTLTRCAPLADEEVFVVTSEAYGFKSRQEERLADGVIGNRVFHYLEPVGRNTAPAIVLAALAASERDPDTTMLVLPADHLIPDELAFQSAARSAALLAETGRIVVFGIQPTAPETGFGYIECGAMQDGGGHAVTRFVEKPDAERAMEFLASGQFLWNAGMLCGRASVILDAVRQHAPELFAAASKVYAESRLPGDDGRSCRFDPEAFGRLPDASFDYAVLEHVEDLLVMPCSFAWSDIGSWKSLSQQLPTDEQGNTRVGDVIQVDTRNTHVQSDDRVVAAVGLDDLLIVDTADALLVAHKDKSQQVRTVVEQLRLRGHEAASLHRTVVRPWGTFTTLHESPRSKIKEIVVRPGETLSLQMHHHRSEHWVVLSGSAEVTCGERTHMVYASQSTYIPVGTTHRLANPGKVDLVIIEVQSGDYVGEDDIVRFDDRYGRAPSRPKVEV